MKNGEKKSEKKVKFAKEKRLRQLKRARDLTNPFYMKDKIYEKNLKESNQKKNLSSLHKVKLIEEKLELENLIKKAGRFGEDLREKLVKKLEKEQLSYVMTDVVKKAKRKRKFFVQKTQIS